MSVIKYIEGDNVDNQITVNISMDRDLKESADISIPFLIKPYNDYKIKIEQSFRQADEGKLTAFTINELEAFEDMDKDKAKEFIEARRREVAS